MSKIKQEVETRCELALMGKVQEVRSNDEVQFMFNYLKGACGYECMYNKVDIIKDRINMYSKNNKVSYITAYRVYGMPCICFLLESTDEPDGENYYPAPFEEDYGTGCPCAFCYVLNLASDETCSEFGDVFFDKIGDGFFHFGDVYLVK